VAIGQATTGGKFRRVGIDQRRCKFSHSFDLHVAVLQQPLIAVVFGAPQQGRVIVTHHHGLVRSSLSADRARPASSANSRGLGTEGTAVLDAPCGPQDLAARTAQQVVLAVVPETPQGTALRIGSALQG